MLLLRLIGYEIYKLFRSKGVYIGFIMCLLVYGIYAYSSVPSVHNNYHRVYKYYKVGEGPVTNQDILAANKGIVSLNMLHDAGIRFTDKELGEMLLYRDIGNSVKESSRYDKLINTLKYSNGSKKERVLYNILRKVGPLKGAYYTEGWKEIIDFWGNLGYYLVVILGIFGVSRIFPDEKATGMDVINDSTKEGSRRLIMAKIAAAILFIGTITVFFELVNLLFNAFYYGLAGWNVPLKNIFFRTPYNLEIWQFWMFRLFVAAAATTILGLFALLVSVVTKNSVISLVAVGTVFLVYDISTRKVSVTGTGGPVGLFTVDFVRLKGFCTNYTNIYELFGHGITYEQLLGPTLILLLLFMIFITYITCRRLK